MKYANYGKVGFHLASLNLVGGNFPLMTEHGPQRISTAMWGWCGALHFLQ
jgi:hypothetical protein